MNIGMLLAVFGVRRTTVTETFTSNAAWTAQTTTSRIDTLVGSGASGTPAQSGAWGYTSVTEITFYDAWGNVTGSQTSQYPDTFGEPAPQSYCTTEPNGTGTKTTCWNYGDFDNSTPATTGASATGFGKTFIGGTGGVATPVTHSNVAVTPGATYSLVVPAGGSITITYTR